MTCLRTCGEACRERSDAKSRPRSTTRFRHARDSRGPRARSLDRRDHDADLCNVDVRAVESRRAQGLRLRADRKSDARRAGGLRGRSRKRGARSRLRFGSRRHGDRARRARCGRAHRGERRSLRRDVSPVRERAQALGELEHELCRYGRPGEPLRGDPSRNENDLGRDAEQSAAQVDRPRCGGEDRARTRSHRGGRQHVRQPMDSAAPGAGL